ncbi:MAG: hypothetical protein RR308_09390, partial [Hafnia sp.]
GFLFKNSLAAALAQCDALLLQILTLRRNPSVTVTMPRQGKNQEILVVIGCSIQDLVQTRVALKLFH